MQSNLAIGNEVNIIGLPDIIFVVVAVDHTVATCIDKNQKLYKFPFSMLQKSKVEANS